MTNKGSGLMKLCSVVMLSVCLIACSSADKFQTNLDINGYKLPINGDTAMISEEIWQLMGLKNYPFTKAGDIACSLNAVEFYPDTLKEESVGLPLNKLAVDRQKSGNLIPNVENAIKTNAQLEEAIELGLKICSFNHENLIKK